MKVFFVTTNVSKVASPARILARHGIEVVQVDIELREIQAVTVAEVAASKAWSALAQLKSPVIVNDGGVYIDALKGFPGTYAKHVNKQIGIDGYLDLMARFPQPAQRRCSVQDAVAYIDPSRPAPAVLSRVIGGTFADAPRGTNRNTRLFLAPMFIPDGYDKTYAEMTDGEYDAFRSRPEHEAVYEGLAAAILGTQQTFE